MVYHFPCDVKFTDQRTGLGNCPERLTIDIPIFTDSTVRYVPWQDLMDDSIPELHYESLKIKPLQSFNKSTLDALDKTLKSLDQNVDRDLDKFDSDISEIQETSTTTTNDILTYFAFAMGFLNFCLFIFLACRAQCSSPLYTVPRPTSTSATAAPEIIALEELPKCKDCHRPRVSSV